MVMATMNASSPLSYLMSFGTLMMPQQRMTNQILLKLGRMHFGGDETAAAPAANLPMDLNFPIRLAD